MTENEISFEIRGAIYEVYNELGPGLLESIYAAALAKELYNRGIKYRSEVPIEVNYKGDPLGLNLRLDLLVENKVVIELKSVEELHEVHHKQILSYLRLTGLKLGILVNFNCSSLRNNIYRKVNDL